MMACAFAIAQPAALAPYGRNKRFSSNLARLPSPTVSGKLRSRLVVAKAVQDSSEPSTGSVVEYVKNAFKSYEDIVALAGIGFAAIAAFWASVNLIEAIDKLPIVPTAFELIGILYSWWFIYRYLLFKPDREEFLKNIKSSLSQILGQ